MMSGGTLGATVGDEHDPSAVLSTPSAASRAEVSQLRADLSSRDLKGKEVTRKTLSLNDPLRCSGITIYKTDRHFPPLKTNGDKMLVVTFVPVEDSNSSSNAKEIVDAGSPNANGTEDASSPDVKGAKEADDSPNVKKTEDDADSPNVKGISMVATDSQSIIVYHKEGKVVGVRQHNSQLPIEADGTEIVIVDTIGSAGLDLEIDDPGAKIVYTGFGALMLMNCINYLSNAEIWALQDGTTVIVGGKTYRAKGEFPDEIIRLLDQVPAEIFESSSSSSTESDDLTG